MCLESYVLSMCVSVCRCVCSGLSMSVPACVCVFVWLCVSAIVSVARDMSVSCVYMCTPNARHMYGYLLHSNTHCCLWSGHTRKQSNSLALSSVSTTSGTRCRCPSYERFLKGCSSPFTRLADHLTALRTWCKQCLPGWCTWCKQCLPG